MTQEDCYRQFEGEAKGHVRYVDYLVALRCTMEEIQGPWDYQLREAAQLLLLWYNEGEFSGVDLPGFVISHRRGMVWATLLRQQHNRESEPLNLDLAVLNAYDPEADRLTNPPESGKLAPQGEGGEPERGEGG